MQPFPILVQKVHNAGLRLLENLDKSQQPSSCSSALAKCCKAKWGINSSASDHVSCVTVTFSKSPHLWATVLSPIPPAVSYFYIPSYFSMTDLFSIALLCFIPLAFISTCKAHRNPGFKTHSGKGKKVCQLIYVTRGQSHFLVNSW